MAGGNSVFSICLRRSIRRDTRSPRGREQRYLQADLPLRVGKIARVDRIVVTVGLPNHRLIEEPRDLSESAAKGNEPLVLGGSPPVRGQDR